MISVKSPDYGELIPMLLARRLKLRGIGSVMRNGTLFFEAETDEACGVLTECILHDLKPLETARFINYLPISLRDKRRILPRAVELFDEERYKDYTRLKLLEYLSENNNIAPEGFLRFRLPLVMEELALAVDTAAYELFIDRD